MARTSRTGSARGASFNQTPGRIRRSAGRRVVVDERVPSAMKRSRSFDRVTPMEHGFEATFLVLFDFRQAKQPDADLTPSRRGVRLMADYREHRHCRFLPSDNAMLRPNLGDRIAVGRDSTDGREPA